MALIFLESFDGLQGIPDFTGKWTAFDSGASIVTGRPPLETGHQKALQLNNGLSGNDSPRRAFTTAEEDDLIIVGWAYKADGVPIANVRILDFMSDASTTGHISVWITPNGEIAVYRWSGADSAGALLGDTDANLIQGGSWQFIEVKVRLHDTTGTVDVRIDGTSRLSLSGLDTKNGGTKTVFDAVRWQYASINFNNAQIDDVHILNEKTTDADGNTSTLTDFVGDCFVYGLLPNGNGDSSQFTGSDGNSIDNYLLVDEADPDDDTTYVESSTAGQKDLYNFEDLPSTSGIVRAVQGYMLAKRSAGTDNVIARLVAKETVGAVENEGGDETLTATYGWFGEIWEKKPNSATDPWTPTLVNSGQWGHKVQSITP